VRGRALPDGEWVDLFADGDGWTTDPVRGAELVGEGWLLPGLVDAHTHRVDHADLPKVAAAQAAATGWAKLIGDRGPGDDPVPVAVLRQVVVAVHAVGGRVAVHSQQPAGGIAAVAAGVDSLEHGICLDPGAPADVVVYDEDPRTDLARLDVPRAVVLRGRLVAARR